MKIVVDETSYKGAPMIRIMRGPHDRYPFQFGLRKAEMIIAAIQDIKQFVDKWEKVAKSYAQTEE